MLELSYRTSTRTVAGLMSGTSLDGVDVAVARIAGSGPEMTIEILEGRHLPYPEELSETILKNTRPATSSVDQLTRLHVRLGQIYAAAVEDVLADSSFSGTLDLIGSHGQTIYHQPDPEPFLGQQVASTLQLGNTSTIAARTGVPVVGDFRSADVALGGEGAPLVPYFDYIYFTHPDKSRLLLNIGGIANVTFLPANGPKAQVRAFDTGPGNMLIDRLVQRLFGEPFDEEGRRARQGNVCEPLLEQWLEDDSFLHETPPKSTGREYYDEAFLEHMIGQARRRGCAGSDLVATVTAFTAHSIYTSYQRFLAPDNPVDEVIAAGGGIHNRMLMTVLADLFRPVPVTTTRVEGLDPDYKEALCFAVLAHEFVNEVPTNLPSVTGASRETLLGTLAVPYQK